MQCVFTVILVLSTVAKVCCTVPNPQTIIASAVQPTSHYISSDTHIVIIRKCKIILGWITVLLTFSSLFSNLIMKHTIVFSMHPFFFKYLCSKFWTLLHCPYKTTVLIWFKHSKSILKYSHIYFVMFLILVYVLIY